MAKQIRYLFSNRNRIENLLKGKFVYLFLDYDGTLSRIADMPDRAFIPKKTKELIRELSKFPECRIAVISGRALKDIKKRIGIKNIVYAGNHGLEIEGPKINYSVPLSPNYKKILKKIKSKLGFELEPIKGVFLEDKGFSFSVHYRLVDKKKIPLVKSAFYSITLPYKTRNDIKIGYGKKVLEIKPPLNWNKGKVVLWLLAKKPFTAKEFKKKVLPIYIGDDITDEDAFKVLKKSSIAIFVGKAKDTKAGFYLKNPAEVAEFLRVILERLRD